MPITYELIAASMRCREAEAARQRAGLQANSSARTGRGLLRLAGRRLYGLIGRRR